MKHLPQPKTQQGAYQNGDQMTYVVTLTNSGDTALNGLTLTDDLGGYAVGTTTVYPLEYLSILYYVNGVLQPAPTVAAGPPLTITGINVPANGEATVVYEATTTEFAPLGITGAINNTVTVTGAGITTALTAEETVTADNEPNLVIDKSVSPTTVPGQITVPAATFVQDPVTGIITTTPGESILTVMGTV